MWGSRFESTPRVVGSRATRYMRNPDVYLASASPRRRELLRQIGVRYRLVDAQVDESMREGEGVADYALRIAREKARMGRAQLPPTCSDIPVLGADTVVVVDGIRLGKPAGREDALAMLRALSGRSHEVLSAVAVAAGQGAEEQSRLSRSVVWFRTLAERECIAYWDSGEPVDKAGAYAIQGLAAAFIPRLEGSFSGVMGLPLFETVELLRAFGVRVLDLD